ncbi:hypothetical protein HUW86_09630 [Fusobacterium sp. SB021]|uniref:hypothetical protein n=1 Tax=Fusobacterium sp. SB021 TaxID=2744227 RepID=UPI003CFA64B5
MKRKTTTTDLKNLIRQKFEAGQDLIDLAIEYKINYGTLRNLSSKENWQKGILKDIVYIKETEKLTKEIAKKRENKRKEYRERTQEIMEDLQSLEGMDMQMYVALGEEKKSYAETKATVVKLRTSSIKELYSIDKELYQILNATEEQELAIKRLKYEELKRKQDL